ncbi:hypothetical protein [Lujinxingia sediminis]|nr:hypothetical protein [Lujinxingia sediminis]
MRVDEASDGAGFRAGAVVAVMVLAWGFGGGMGCERAPASEEKAEATEAVVEPGDEAEEEHDEDHAHDEVHLGAHMFEIGRRYSAVWYAGEAGNKAMVDYQIHEIEEVIEELREARPVEEGVDVVDYFERSVLPSLERIEEAVEAGDTATFEREYDAVITQCNACHTATKHAFIEIGRPAFNPYANVKMDAK